MPPWAAQIGVHAPGEQWCKSFAPSLPIQWGQRRRGAPVARQSVGGDEPHAFSKAPRVCRRPIRLALMVGNPVRIEVFVLEPRL